LWPTPTTIGNEFAPSMLKHAGHRRLREALPTPLASDFKGQSKDARERRGHGGPRLTRDLATERGYLPTPTATLYGSNQSPSPGATKRKSLEGMTGGVWIALREWMMGWPIGWTALEPLATDRWLEWRRCHGDV
jgi:hypothetical protein